MENSQNTITVALNGDPASSVRVELNQDLDSLPLLKQQIASCFKIKLHSNAWLYSAEGIEILDDDFYFVKAGDSYFYAPKGKII